MTQEPTDLEPAVRAYLSALGRGDAAGCAAALEPNAVVRFPFADSPPGVTLRSAREVEAFLSKFLAPFAATPISGLTFAGAPSKIFAVVTFTARWHLETDGWTYENRYVVLAQGSGGRITGWTEYFDPRPTEEMFARIGAKPT